MKTDFSQIKYIAFDLDGTLVDSVPDLAQALRMMLADLGRDSVSDDEVRNWIGNGAEIMIKRTLSKNIKIDPELSQEVYEIARTRFDYYYETNGHQRTQVYPGVMSTLKALKEKGYTLGIVTNKPHVFVPEILNDLHLAEYFSDVIGGDLLKTNKPDPEGLLSLREKHGLQDNQMLMVGDSKNDILAAQRANFSSIGLTYGYNYGEPIADSQPSVVCDEFSQILTLFSSQDLVS